MRESRWAATLDWLAVGIVVVLVYVVVPLEGWVF